MRVYHEVRLAKGAAQGFARCSCPMHVKICAPLTGDHRMARQASVSCIQVFALLTLHLHAGGPDNVSRGLNVVHQTLHKSLPACFSNCRAHKQLCCNVRSDHCCLGRAWQHPYGCGTRFCAGGEEAGDGFHFSG